MKILEYNFYKRANGVWRWRNHLPEAIADHHNQTFFSFSNFHNIRDRTKSSTRLLSLLAWWT
ncbi:hypothetical protein [Nostoc sp.]|uniref:hypothetical protein n=1 Tax=Nostoc sp. TaxID=1180 RepID=UPI002FF9C8C0